MLAWQRRWRGGGAGAALRRGGWMRSLSSRVVLGDVEIVRPSPQLPAPHLIPEQSFAHFPNEVVGHFRWMAQKYNMEQDMFLCGHPGPLRRNLVFNFAAVAGLEIEYLALSRDTTENDLKQRREIQGGSVVFHDQPPVRAAMNGRVLVLDGIEYAERNVLPTLNNLLENREMALEDGRFLTKLASANKSGSSLLEEVKPSFRVIALGQCVPPYSGRTMDPPLRSRFQSRFVDELSAEAVIELFKDEVALVDPKRLRQLIEFYEAMRIVRLSIVNEGGTGIMSGVPVFSVDSFAHCLALLRAFPDMTVASCLQRCVPAGSWMHGVLASRLKPSITSAFEKIGQFLDGHSGVGASEYNFVGLANSSKTSRAAVDASFTREKSKDGASKAAVPLIVGCKFSGDTALDAARAPINERLLPSQTDALSRMLMDHASNKHICLLGPKGSGKSFLAKKFGSMLGYRTRTFPLYQELTARDLLQRRVTNGVNTTIVESNGASALPLGKSITASSGWIDSPLVAAARAGDLCILDGVDRVDPQVLFTLRSLLQDGFLDLPNGERLVAAPASGDDGGGGGGDSSAAAVVSSIHPAFRVVALGQLPNPSRPEDARERWVSSDLGFAYHALAAEDSNGIVNMLEQHRQQAQKSSSPSSSLDNTAVEVPAKRGGLLRSALQSFSGMMSASDKSSTADTAGAQLANAVRSLNAAGSEFPELKLSLRQILRLSRLTGSGGGKSFVNAGGASTLLDETLERMLMVEFMPALMKARFYKTLESLKPSSSTASSEDVDDARGDAATTRVRVTPPPPSSTTTQVVIDDIKETLSIGDVTIARKAPGLHPEKIPWPLFYENAAHLALLRELLYTISVGEKALLLIGNQGVGKNKLTDRLLQLMNMEREYIQLHRDTTIQSLTLLPSLDGGRITFADAPMVRAARAGRALVVDEADKAPLEVVCLLKALAEDGEVMLYDGRRLLSHARLLAEGGDPVAPPDDVVLIHPDFLLIVLANRPGFPFLGNNFFRECGDIFSVHVVNNLDMESEVELLRAYGPDVNEHVVRKLASAFAGLRDAHSQGHLSYPFSAREAVSVIKHVAAYPQDGVLAAVEDILGFDSLSPLLRRQIAAIFRSYDLPIPDTASPSLLQRPPVRLTTPRSLSAPQQYTLDVDRSTTQRIAGTERHMRDSEWYAQGTTSSAYTVTSNRLLEFSEEVGRLQAGEPVVAGTAASSSSASTSLGHAVAMVSDNGSGAGRNALHVLTIEPLALHTFCNAAAAVDAFRGRSTGSSTTSAVAQRHAYVRRELVSQEMSWRLGTVTPLLVPLGTRGGGGDGGGCVVIIPEISVAIVAEEDPHVAVKALLLSKADKGSAAAMKEVFRKNLYFGGTADSHGFSSSSSASTKRSSSRSLGRYLVEKDPESDAVVLYQEGSTEFSVLDFRGRSSRHFALDDVLSHGISSMRCVAPGRWMISTPATASGNDEDDCFDVSFPVTGNGDQCEVTKIRTLTGSSTAPVTKLSQLLGPAISASSGVNVLRASPAGQQDLQSGSSLLASAKAAAVRFGSATADSGSLRAVEAWPSDGGDSGRSALVRVEAAAAAPNLLATAYTTSAPLSPEDGNASSSHKSGDHREVLEIVDVEAQRLTSLSLVRAGHRPDSRKRGTIAGIALLRNDLATLTFRSAADEVVAVCHRDGVVRLFEVQPAALEESRGVWERFYSSRGVDPSSWSVASPLLRGNRLADKSNKPRTGVGSPKHGKEDPKNEPHVGGNTWAGGTGGSDTAGLGGRGGPYRLDKGHRVHQVSDEMKAAVAAQGREAALKIAKEALAKRLEEISMGRGDYDVYMKYRANVEAQIAQVRSILEEFSRRSRERIWLKHQAQGDLDDSKLVDGLAGDRLVFKRRGLPDALHMPHAPKDNSGENAHKKKLMFVVDCSGSMYRFNGQDRRLERTLEAVLLILEAMPTAAAAAGAGGIDYCVVGHSGDSDSLSFVDFNSSKPTNEAERMAVLESMAAHTQYTQSGDNTLNAMAKATKHILDVSEGDEYTDRYVFVISDANFERYGIRPEYLSSVMLKDRRVQTHLILIASLADEVDRFVRLLPAGRTHVCFETTSMPSVFRSILTATGGALDI